MSTGLMFGVRIVGFGVVAAIAGCASVTPPDREATAERVCFVDEATRDPTLVAFRARLIAAARSRDIERLRPLVWDEIELEKERPAGFDALRRSYLDDKETPFWGNLETMLLRGGVFETETSFCAPFYSCPVPPPWAGALVILGRRVPAYQAPSRSSPIVGHLSCTVYRFPEGDLRNSVPDGNKDFVPAPLANGTWAFVESGLVAISESFLYIGKRDGKWLLLHYGGFD